MDDHGASTPTRAIIAAAIIVGLVLAAWAGPVLANHKPADKVAVSGASLEIVETQLDDGSSSDTVTVLQGEIKSSSPTDLILQVSLECAIWTDITTVGNDHSSSAANVTVWVTIDGDRVPVSSSGLGNGEVVFCNRTFERETLQFDDEDATIRSYLRTRQANAFNWMSLNVGSGDHTIAVHAQLEASVENEGRAKAAIGQRTLLVEPTKLANDASL